jgi:hypothetical protein
MAESIIIHFRTADPATMVAAVIELGAVASGKSGKFWRYPNENAYTLSIYPYEDFSTEYSPDDQLRVHSMLGGLPSTSVALELRRSSGIQAVQDAAAVATELLRLLDGIVDDTYSELWTLQDIESRRVKQDGAFMDCYRSRQG